MELHLHFSHLGSDNVARARGCQRSTSTFLASHWLSYSFEKTTEKGTFPTRHVLCLSSTKSWGGLFRTSVLIECPDDQRTMSSSTRLFHHPR